MLRAADKCKQSFEFLFHKDHSDVKHLNFLANVSMISGNKDGIIYLFIYLIIEAKQSNTI